MGANVLRGQFSQDVGRLFFTRVSLLCSPIAQNSQSPFVVLKKLPTGQHTTRPGLLTKALFEMISTHSVEHQIRVKFLACQNMPAVLVTCATVHLETSALNAAAELNTTHHRIVQQKTMDTKVDGKKSCKKQCRKQQTHTSRVI